MGLENDDLLPFGGFRSMKEGEAFHCVCGTRTPRPESGLDCLVFHVPYLLDFHSRATAHRHLSTITMPGIQGSGFRVQGPGFWVQGLRIASRRS